MSDNPLDNLLLDYDKHPCMARMGKHRLPNPERLEEVLALLRDLIFPGFRETIAPSGPALENWAGRHLHDAQLILSEEIQSLLNKGQDAAVLVRQFAQQLPAIRGKLALDVQAAFDGDPAATCPMEAIACYPGLEAIYTHRIANALHRLNIPLVPRMMAELAHTRTGADIHPGATIGDSFFIDHATGVVIGETCIIGNRVKIYQGVTLGATSTRGGQSLRGAKRHPTIEDDVTIYPHATILGGDTIIGKRSLINGSVFLTHSVPAEHTVRIHHPRPMLRGHQSDNGSDWVI